MNHRRYTTYILSQVEQEIGFVDLSEIQTMLKSDPKELTPFGFYYINISRHRKDLKLSHLIKEFSHLIQIDGSPFSSQKQAASALSRILGHGVGHRTIGSYVDKLSLYKGRFFIKSYPFKVNHS
jgi:hypothetical protein